MQGGAMELHVIFGTGPLGKAVMRELLRRGKRVRMLNSSGTATVPSTVEVRKCDAYSSEAVRGQTTGATVMYQCAAPPYHQWPEKFPAMQAAILEGVSRAGARLIVAENLYMYGQVTGKIHEGLPYRAHTRKGKVRASMAEAILEAHAGGQVQAAIGRGSDFFGPEVFTSTLGERVFYPALQGKTAQFVGSLDVSHTYTFIDDFGSALVLLGERDEGLGQVWHVPNDRPDVTQRMIGQMIFEEIGMPPKMSGMGKMMMRIGGLFVAGARETVEMMYEFEEPFVVDSGKFEKAFGVKAAPIQEALRRTVEWFRTHPKVAN